MTKDYPSLTAKESGEAIRAFRAERCPACDSPKVHVNHPFCLTCIDHLTPSLKADVFDRETFISAFHPAMRHLRSK